MRQLHIHVEPRIAARAEERWPQPAPTGDGLVDTYNARLNEIYGFCYRRLYCPDAADDATGMVFLKLVERQDDLKDMDSRKLRQWLYGTARNAITATLRQKRRDKALAEAMARQMEEAYLPKEVFGDDPVVAKAVARLTYAQQEVVILHFLQGLDIVDTAATMKISINNARVHLSRATKALRAILTPTQGREL